MKKLLCVLAAIAIVATFTTSCNKKCTCKVNGITATYDLKKIKDMTGIEINNCAELSAPGWECK